MGCPTNIGECRWWALLDLFGTPAYVVGGTNDPAQVTAWEDQFFDVVDRIDLMEAKRDVLR